MGFICNLVCSPCPCLVEGGGTSGHERFLRGQLRGWWMVAAGQWMVAGGRWPVSLRRLPVAKGPVANAQWPMTEAGGR